jgi:hypothetical protein
MARNIDANLAADQALETFAVSRETMASRPVL